MNYITTKCDYIPSMFSFSFFFNTNKFLTFSIFSQIDARAKAYDILNKREKRFATQMTQRGINSNIDA